MAPRDEDRRAIVEGDAIKIGPSFEERRACGHRLEAVARRRENRDRFASGGKAIDFSVGAGQRIINARLACNTLVPDDESGALLHIVDGKRKRIYLLGGEILRKIVNFIAKSFGHIIIDGTMFGLDMAERVVGRIAQIARDQGVKRGSALRGDFVIDLRFFRFLSGQFAFGLARP